MLKVIFFHHSNFRIESEMLMQRIVISVDCPLIWHILQISFFNIFFFKFFEPVYMMHIKNQSSIII